MKIRIIVTMLSSAVVLLSSCNKELTQLPTTSKVMNSFISNQSETEEYVNSAYAALQLNGLYGLYVPTIGEIASDNTFDQVPANDDGVFGQLDLFTTIASNGLLSQNWRDSYKAIQRANVVLSRIGNIKYSSDSLKSSRIGAMKFIRSLVYFNLIRTFGDVPYVTKETTDPLSYLGQGRTSKDSIYLNILNDLNDAISKLPLNADKIGGVTRNAALALQGKIYLTLGQYQSSANSLQQIVNSGVQSLVSTPDKVFDINNENNSEIIFSVQFAAGLNGNSEGSSMQQMFSPSGFESGAKGHDLPTQSFYNLYTVSDLRRAAYIGTTSSGVYYCKKYAPNSAVPSDGGSNFVVLRYADVLLMLAEDFNELNQTQQALPYLNMIRQRAGLSNFVSQSQSEIRTEIALQRRLELIGEGHRWFDLIRTGMAVSTMNTWFSQQGTPITIDTHNLLLPVPQDQIDTDPSIKQNPGY